MVGDEAIIGLSTHAVPELEAAVGGRRAGDPVARHRSSTSRPAR